MALEISHDMQCVVLSMFALILAFLAPFTRPTSSVVLNSGRLDQKIYPLPTLVTYIGVIPSIVPINDTSCTAPIFLDSSLFGFVLHFGVLLMTDRSHRNLLFMIRESGRARLEVHMPIAHVACPRVVPTTF